MTQRSSRTAGSKTLGIGLLSLTLALLMTACQTTNSGSSQATVQKPEPVFRAAVQPKPAPKPKRKAVVLNPSLESVFFAFDRSDLSQDARQSLRTDAKALRKSKGAVVLEGHTDERGTFEYNMALGDRRAHMVKTHLVNLGVRASRIQVKSYGEAAPSVKGHTETAWRENRRVNLQK